jgi:hypothetical protein
MHDREQTEEEAHEVEQKRKTRQAKKARRGLGRGTGHDVGRGRGRGRTKAPPADTDGIVAAGTKFKKVFGECMFKGIVLSHDSATKLYSVRCEDGDQEDLDHEELEDYLSTD